MDPSMGVTEDENLQRWILGSDKVIVRVTGKAVGLDGLTLDGLR